MSKIVVFGGDGFIGRHLIKILAAESASDEIIAFDRFSGYQVGTDHPFEELTNVKIIAGNFFNRAELSNVLKGATYVFHLVSSTNPATSSKDPFIDIDTNVRSSIELFELCVEYGVNKVIFPSSGGTVYGDIDSEKISENVVPAPRSPYGIGKLTIEDYLRYFKFAFGLDYVVYRIANPYGPGQNIHGKQGVIPIFMNRFLSNEPVTVYGKGDMVRDYIYIEDLIKMITGSYREASKHNVYNLGSGKGESVNELIGAMEKCFGKNIEKKHSPTPPTFVNRSVLDISRFVEEFKISPATNLENGIEKTWDYVRNLSK